MKKWVTATEQNKIGVISKRNIGLKNSREIGFNEGKIQFNDSPMARYLNLNPEQAYAKFELLASVNANDHLYLKEKPRSWNEFLGFLNNNDKQELQNQYNNDVFLILKNNNEIDVEFILALDNYPTGKVRVDWGDGTVEEGVEFFHSYSTPDNGYIQISMPLEEGQIVGFEFLSGTCSADIGQFSREELDRLQLFNNHKFFGDIGHLPKSLKILEISGNNHSVYGSIDELGEQLTTIKFHGVGNFYGSISKLKSPFYDYIWVNAPNSISGDIQHLPDSVRVINITGNNSIEGDILGMPTAITNFIISGDTTITGDIKNIRNGCGEFIVYGLNTLSGLIEEIPSTIGRFKVSGNNTIEGNIALLTVGADIDIRGANTISGDIALLPAGIQYLSLRGFNTVSGIFNGNNSSLKRLYLYGNNTVAFSASTLGSSLELLHLRGFATLTGSIDQIPSQLPYLNCINSSLTGDLKDLSANMHSLGLHGALDLSYTGNIELNHLSLLELLPDTADLTSGNIDDLLVDIDNSTTEFIYGKVIRLTGNNNPRTSASDAAVASLIAKGVTVETN